MPVMDGIAMMKQAMAERPCTLFVLLSGYGEFEYARGAIRHGAFDYLLKPVDHEELEKVVREVKQKLDAEAKRQSEQEILRSSVQSLAAGIRRPARGVYGVSVPRRGMGHAVPEYGSCEGEGAGRGTGSARQSLHEAFLLGRHQRAL